MVDDGISNPTDNTPFEEIAATRFSRRGMIAGGLATAATTFFLDAGAAAAAPAKNAKKNEKSNPGDVWNFQPIPLGYADDVVVPPGFTATPFLPWGTPILPGASRRDLPRNANDQEKRVGLGHDGMWFFPTDKKATHGVLCLNQEHGTDSHLSAGTGRVKGDRQFVRLSQAAHGVSVVEIEKVGGEWQVVMGSLNRRITPNTPVTFSGPAAGSPQLVNRAGNAFEGTVNNCAGGKTPWGTYLTCEENFNGYFGATGAYEPTAEQARYGLSADGFGYGWHEFDSRFDLSNGRFANEHKRFGWVVEIDPTNPAAAPVKRTALGRFKHENCEIYEGPGRRIVAYMGDDERFDYLYKFVSADDWKRMTRRGISPLDEGTLYVARFDADGTGDWIPLTMDDNRLAFRFADQADLLINTRIAADLVGATPMDRPEWAAVNPTNGEMFVTMTNNSRREAPNPPNPRVPNNDGHILRLVDADGNLGTSFDWDIFLLAGPANDPTSTTDLASEHGSPDGLAFDENGVMYIQTDGGQPNGANDQMLLADPTSGEIKRFLTGVPGCEVTGWTPLDEGSFLVNIQHPGGGDPSVSNWPGEPGDIPRDACVIVSRG